LELLIKIPASYPETAVTIRIAKGDVSVDVTKAVVSGYALMELLDDGPEGFINGYGSPIYEVILINPTSGDVVELQASGDPVTSVIFQVMAGISSETQFKIEY